MIHSIYTHYIRRKEAMSARRAFSDANGYTPAYQRCWWLELPRIRAPATALKAASAISRFCIEDIIGSVQRGECTEEARNYLSFHWEHDKDYLEKSINKNIKDIPAIFYVVETGNNELIRHLVRHGADPNATCGPADIPLLAFAILRGARTRLATTIVQTLLELGASPQSIPAKYYTPFNKLLQAHDDNTDDLDWREYGTYIWCSRDIQRLLVSSLNLSQRYSLYRGSCMEPASARERFLLSRKNAEGVLGLHQVIIGQRTALLALKRHLLTQLISPSPEPSVLLFAGPDGDAKIELARRFGDLMFLEMERVDCTTFARRSELFGHRPPYIGHEFGSRLNKFLSKMSGKRSVVFMDKFEKTSEEIQNALLILFKEGRYIDRRNSREINCSQVIWILAVNKLDRPIHEF